MHTKSELVLLGRLEDSLGDRQRASNGVTPDESASRANLAEMIDLERRIDGRIQIERAVVAAGRRRRRWWRS